MAARGLDIPEVDLVIQCEPPKVRVEGWRERRREGGREGERERDKGGREREVKGERERWRERQKG